MTLQLKVFLENFEKEKKKYFAKIEKLLKEN